MGMGGNGLVAMDLMQKLQRIGIPAYYYPDMDLQLTMACNLGEGDLFIGISYSGKNKNVVKALHQARAKGAGSITLTRFGNNKLSDSGDIKLFVPCGGASDKRGRNDLPDNPDVYSRRAVFIHNIDQFGRCTEKPRRNMEYNAQVK